MRLNVERCLKRCVIRTAILALIFFISTPDSQGFELTSRYSTLVYEREDLLRTFNKEISLGSLSYLTRNMRSITSDDEIRNKMDVLVERIEVVLDMYPKDVKVRIVLLSSDTEVQKVYKARYNRNVDFIAFYATKEKTVYVSVSDIRLGVLAHELAHMIIDHYFGVSPPVKIHEVLAQFVEKNLKD